MQGQVDAAKAYLESAEGQDFEKQVQESFLGGSPAKQSQLGQDSDSSNNDTGNAGQGEDSTSGMNSAPSDRLQSSDSDDTNDASAYNQAGSETAQNEGPYTETDPTSSGGYGTNEAGDSFSQANQSGLGQNSSGQFQ